MDTDLSALDSRTVARVCGVTERTARGWRQRGDWPEMARRLLRLVVLGDMEELGGRDWRHWTMNARNELCSPDNQVWDSGRLGAWWIERQQIPTLKQEVRRLRAGMPIIDRDELARLQDAQAAASRAAHELARLYPRAADAGARGDDVPAAPCIAAAQ